jgi:hypothetical protein
LLQFIDLNSLKEDFLQESRDRIPLEFMEYAQMWETSAAHFVDIFLAYLEKRGLEVSFKQSMLIS